jgi:hypothetical protein
LFAVVLIGWGCEHKGELNPNVQPIARLANIPPDNFISQNPRMTLYWVGDDPDGYVTGFRYRWSFRLSGAHPFEYKAWATLLNIGIDKSGTEKFALMTDADFQHVPDVYKYFATLPPEGIAPDSATKIDAGDSIFVGAYRVWASNPTTVRFPVHVNPNGGTFIFDSQDSLNPHTFEVEAIDNLGDTSKPATVFFQTPQVPPPHAQIVTFPQDTAMVSDVVTDVDSGLTFGFQGFDPNSRTVEFSWVVNRDEWAPAGKEIPWSEFSQNPIAKVNASNFVNPKDTVRTKHTIYVRAKNEFGSIDTSGYFLRAIIQNSQIVGYDTVWANQDFFCVYPTWLADTTIHRILLLNASYGFAGTKPSEPSRDQLDAYYSTIFDGIGYAGKYDIIRAVDAPRYYPSLKVFGRYRTIFLYNEINVPGNNQTGIDIHPELLTQYLGVGGKIVNTSWTMPFQVSSTFYAFGPHMESVPSPYIRTNDSAFVGATGFKGYPTFRFDSVKTADFGGGLFFACAGRSVGFGEIIYTFVESKCHAESGGRCVSWDGRTVGVKYDGLVYKYIFLGFPLYYCDQGIATQIVARAFSDIGE